jgi:chromate transporter
MEKTKLIDIFLSFLKIGAIIFGGGYAMLPIITRELVHKRHWLEETDLLDCYAIGQVTPGVIALTTAGLIGTRMRGIKGGVAAQTGICLPAVALSFFVCMLLPLLNSLNLDFLGGALMGIQAAVCALVAHTVYRMARKSVKDVVTGALFLLAFVACMVGVTPVLPIAAAAGAGLIIKSKRE